MIRKIIKTCDCFLDVCQTVSVEDANRYILDQKCVFRSGNIPFLCNLIEKKNLKLEFVVSIVLIIWFVL